MKLENKERSLVEAVKHYAGKYGGFSFGGNIPDGVVVKDPLPKGVTYPNGAKAAVLLTYDCEGNYGNGSGSQAKEVENYNRICARLKENNISGSFYVVGQFAEDDGPGFVEVMLDSGSEVAPHGYAHDLNKIYGGDYVYAGHYGKKENLAQIRDGIAAINKIRNTECKGFRLPYGHFNEFSYEAMAECGIKYTSHLGKDDFIVPGQGYGPQPFTMQLGDTVYPIVEIPLDSQTYDWSIWIADGDANKPFVDAVAVYCKSKNLSYERTPKFGIEIWHQRIKDAVADEAVCVLLCHPTNLAVENEAWGDPIDEFMLPVIDIVGKLHKEGKVWACTGAEMAEFYLEYMKKK